MSTAADRPLTAASAHRRSSVDHSRTSRSARPWLTTIATAHVHLYRLASTRIQAFRQIHRQLAQTTRPTAKHTRPRHQAQAAPGATVTIFREKSHKTSNTTRSAPYHNPTLNAKLHASTNLQQLVPHLHAQQVSPRLYPSARLKTTPQRLPRRLSWRRGHAINSFRQRWALLVLALQHHIHLICLSRHSLLLRRD